MELNIPPTTGSSRKLSESLKREACKIQLLDHSNNRSVIECDLAGYFMEHSQLPLQLINTGSCVEHTNIYGSDFDVMMISRDIKVEEDSLEYNELYPCFVRVNANQFGTMVKGKYLPTNSLKNFDFNDQKFFQMKKFFEMMKKFVAYTLFDLTSLNISSDSSVGHKYSKDGSSTLKGYAVDNSRANTTLTDSEHITQQNISDKQNENESEYMYIHKMIEDSMEDIFCSSIENQYHDDIQDGVAKSGGNKEHVGAGSSTSCNKLDLPTSSDSVHTVDLVPGLLVNGWPSPAAGWITRDRVWPDKETVESVVSQGVHIVAKPLPVKPDEKVDFRLSFSFAEKKLAKAMNETQRLTTIVLKACKKSCRSTEFVSYHIKTAIYWVSEKKSASFWRLDNLSSCVKYVIGYLLRKVRSRLLSHYFIPDMNLFTKFENFREMEYVLLEMYQYPLTLLYGGRSRPKREEYPLEADNLNGLEKPEATFGRTRKKELYEEMIHFMVDHFIRLQNQEHILQTDDIVSKVKACRSQLIKFGRSHTGIEHILFQLLVKTKNHPELLLQAFVNILLDIR